MARLGRQFLVNIDLVFLIIVYEKKILLLHFMVSECKCIIFTASWASVSLFLSLRKKNMVTGSAKKKEQHFGQRSSDRWQADCFDGQRNIPLTHVNVLYGFQQFSITVRMSHQPASFQKHQQQLIPVLLPRELNRPNYLSFCNKVM